MLFIDSSLLQKLIEIKQLGWPLLVIGCLFILLAIYFIVSAVRNYRSETAYFMDLFQKAQSGIIQEAVINNLGIIVYDENGLVYKNDTIEKFKGLMPESYPKTFDAFLEHFDRNNHLKSNYILSIENGVDTVRVEYFVLDRVYDIKIVNKSIDYPVNPKKKTYDKVQFHLIQIEDVTEVRKSERRQKDLAANISHELRTPLTVLRAAENIVIRIDRGKYLTNEEMRAWGERIVVNAVRMSEIVDSFLTLSNNKELDKMGFIDFTKVVVKSVDNVRDYPNAENVKIIMPEEKVMPLAYGMTNLIVRVVTNLLTNAIKYIDYEGKTAPHEVKISFVDLDDKIGIQVSDNGRGIPKKDTEHLFERFYRVDNSGSRDVGGFGLGLAIAKEMAEIYDGTINVASEEGVGSTFTLFLPKAKSAFERVYEDAKAGYISDNAYYEMIMKYLLIEEHEVADSCKYTEILEAMDKAGFNKEGKEMSDADKTRILTMLDEKKFASLVDDLTYVEEVFDDDDDEEDEEDYEHLIDSNPSDTSIGSTADITIAAATAGTTASTAATSSAVTTSIPASQPEVVEIRPEPKKLIMTITPEEQKFDEEASFYAQEVLESLEEQKRIQEEEARRLEAIRAQEELERQKKKEAQELLTMPVQQQSIKQNAKPDKQNVTADTSKSGKPKTESKEKSTEDDKSKDAIHIHPNSEKKGYNGKGVKLFEGKTKSKKDSKGEKRSAGVRAANPVLPENMTPEPVIKSAVRQALDEAEEIDSKITKNNDTEGNK